MVDLSHTAYVLPPHPGREPHPPELLRREPRLMTPEEALQVPAVHTQWYKERDDYRQRDNAYAQAMIEIRGRLKKDLAWFYGLSQEASDMIFDRIVSELEDETTERLVSKEGLEQLVHKFEDLLRFIQSLLSVAPRGTMSPPPKEPAR